ncbi:putative PurR-regulated permease PerM [Wenyingzhuangia heitensis]|uniref:PurR-regulated permease PerM n=1 Tax=Wenyingzhuangia heitensis TaxID=1487859 RepID=A0ABX0U8J4_9FLAO|nr:AI-2E family transporter [Wenyingzhuangia heitensis]NIJ45165.1 putative PurR-regulated permease PerM [Wenyingzhuangia heitensis]
MKLLKLTYLRYVTYSLVSLTLLVFAVVKCKFVLAPLVISILISLALCSVLSRVKKFIKNNFVAVTLVTGTLFAVIYLVVYLISSQISDFYNDYPDIEERIVMLITQTENLLENVFGISNLNFIEATEENKEQILSSASSTISSFFGNIGTFIAYISLIPIYIFLLLLYKNTIKITVKNILQSMQIKSRPLFNETTLLVQRYLKGLFLVMLILGLANSVGLFFIKVPYAFALGFLVAFLAIIPYIGVTIGAILVMLVSFIINQSVSQLISISILFGVIQFIEGNFVTPKIIGNKINLNPLLALIVLFVGEQLWGITGMIVALPLTAIISITIKNLKKESFLKPKV